MAIKEYCVLGSEQSERKIIVIYGEKWPNKTRGHPKMTSPSFRGRGQKTFDDEQSNSFLNIFSCRNKTLTKIRKLKYLIRQMQ